MNNSQFIEAIAVKTAVNAGDVEKVVAGFYEVVQRTLRAGDEVKLNGFGRFYVQHRKAKNGRNPKTGATILITAVNAVKFSASKSTDASVN